MQIQNSALATALAQGFFHHTDGSATALVCPELLHMALENVLGKEHIQEILTSQPEHGPRMVLRVQWVEDKPLVLSSMPFTSEWAARDMIATHLRCELHDPAVNELLDGFGHLQEILTRASEAVFSVAAA